MNWDSFINVICGICGMGERFLFIFEEPFKMNRLNEYEKK